MERLTMTNEELNEIRQCYSDFNCPIKAEEDSITQNFCDRVCDEFQEKCPFKNVGLKLKNYEDAEEQGLLLRLPCKVGDTVYTIHSIASNRHMICEIDNVDKFFLMLSVAEERFGKTVFLTKEEAEQALEEMKGL